MTEQLLIGRRRARPKKRLSVALEPAPAGAAAGPVGGENPIVFPEHGAGGKRVASFSVSALLHGAVLAVLFLLASLAPVMEEQIIPVQLFKEKPPEPEAPAPAPRALAERRFVDYAPAVQAVKPQIVNPRVVADAAPAVRAETLDMDAVASAAAPTQIATSTTVVERVSAVNSPIRARASRVDVAGVSGPVVRGPVRVEGPVGPSAGPRQVAVTGGSTTGTGTLEIGGGSSVREGKLSSRDVLGSPQGTPLVSIDTSVGDGLMRGPGGGSGTGTGSGSAAQADCYSRPEVVSYMQSIEQRTISRWNLPPGVRSNQRVTLRFRVDVAGSASQVSLVRADDNALGASAIDALRAASPFPPMSDPVRCLATHHITATFSNPDA